MTQRKRPLSEVSSVSAKPRRKRAATGSSTEPACVIGVGVSAGGLDALERLFHTMPSDTGAAFVVIQHLSPDFKSLMKELMDRFTPLDTVAVDGRTQLVANTIYLLTPRHDMLIEGNEVYTVDRPVGQKLSLPINRFLRSLAAEWGKRAGAIILSGTGSDGSEGVVEIHKSGGMVLVQSEETAGFDGMPRSAIETGCVDAVLKPEHMAERIQAFVLHTESGSPLAMPRVDDTQEVAEGIPTILKALRAGFDIDFNFYKPSTITRRIERRAAIHPDKPTLEEYGRLLQDNRQELSNLYKDLLIGVTRFFRDPKAFKAVETKALSKLLDGLKPGEELRIWVCACSTGEEAYTLAILALEGMEKRGLNARVKVLATDIHDESIKVAAEGVYPRSALGDLPKALRTKYFMEHAGGGLRVTANLRKSIIFSEHNVLQDPPFTRIDLVSCRNMLIYLEPAAQLRAIAAFHFALKLNGFLFLGTSEGLGDLAEEFNTEDRVQKVYRKIRDNRSLNELRMPLRQDPNLHQRRSHITQDMRLGRAYELLLAKLLPCGMLINERREALHIFGDASRYLSAPKGKVTTDILSMTSGHLRIAIMAALRTANTDGQRVMYTGVQWSDNPDEDTLDITVESFEDSPANAIYYLIRLEPKSQADQPIDITPETPEGAQRVAERLANLPPGRAEHMALLETELQRAQDSLQSTVEELETSNEELQAANEELLASNEELQSTNEELHSVNEELYSVNAEHEVKFQELTVATSDLQNLVRSTELATLFIDNGYIIRLFSPYINEVFPLIAQDVGRDLRHFMPRDSDKALFDDLAMGIAGEPVPERTLPWQTGTTFLRRVTPYTDANNQRSGLVITYIDVTEIRRLNDALSQSLAQLEAVFQTSPNGLLVADNSGKILMCNTTLERMFGYAAGQLKGQSIETLVPEKLRTAHQAHRTEFAQTPQQRAMSPNRTLQGRRKDQSTFPIEVQLGPFESNGQSLVQATVLDVSERQQHEVSLKLHRDRLEMQVNRRTEELTQANNRLREVLTRAEAATVAKGRFLANMSHEIRTPLNGILGLVELLRQEAGLNEEHLEMTQRIANAGRRLMSVINDVLDVSRVEAGKLTLDILPFKTHDLVDSAVSMVEEMARGKGLVLKAEVDASVPGDLEGDINRLSQILLNLLSNAVKFTERGSVTLRVSTEKASGADSESPVALRIEVKDTGPGIPAADHGRIFMDFEQGDDSARRTHKGTGLGLAIVRHLTGLMNGRYGVASEPGKGSTFWVQIPLTRPTGLALDVSAPAGAAEQLLREQHAGARVLLVEDEVLNQQVASGMLKNVGLEVLVADHGQAALDLLRTQSVDLVLMDMQMPVMDGPQTTEAIRAMKGKKTLPIVAMTANAFPEDRERCRASGMNDFLAKPFEQKQLLAMVLQWLSKPRKGGKTAR